MRDTPVTELGLSVRPLGCLFDNEIKTVGEIMDMPDSHMLRMPNLGKKSLKEIRDAIHALGARMRIDPPEEEKPFIEWCYRHRDVLDVLRQKLP